MSQETVVLARRVMDALSRGDLAGMISFADPDVAWHSFFAELGEGGVYRGHEGTRNYVDDLRDAWEVVRADVDDVIAAGEVAVLVGSHSLPWQGERNRNGVPRRLDAEVPCRTADLLPGLSRP